MLILLLAIFGSHSALSKNHSILSQGTYWIFDTDPQLSAADQLSVENYLRAIDEEFSEWNSQSWIRQSEKYGWTQPFRVSKTFMEIVDITKQLPSDIGTLFDPSVEKYRRNLGDKKGRWSDLVVISKNKAGGGIVRFNKDPGALSLSGALKGFEVAELFLTLSKRGYKVNSINSGGGNLLRAHRDFILIESHSASHQNRTRSIFHPSKNLSEKTPTQISLYCALDRAGLSSSEIVKASTLADIYSTVLILEPTLKAPANCRVDNL